MSKKPKKGRAAAGRNGAAPHAAPPPGAQVVHAIPGRARLRVADRRGDAEWFARTADALAELAAVARVTANAATGSLLLEHDGDLAPVLAHAEERGLLRVAPEADGERTNAGATRLDPRVARLLRGELDRQGGVALALAALGALQVSRGQVLPAGVSMLTEAYKMLFGRDAAAPDAEPAGDGE